MATVAVAGFQEAATGAVPLLLSLAWLSDASLGALPLLHVLQPASLLLPQLTLPTAWLYLLFFIHQMAPPLLLGLRMPSA